MAISKIVFGDRTLIDLTADTATAADVVAGKTLHLASGETATGTYAPIESYFPIGSFYTTADGTVQPAAVLGFGTWTLVNPLGSTWGDLLEATWGAIKDALGRTIYVYERTA